MIRIFHPKRTLAAGAALALLAPVALAGYPAGAASAHARGAATTVRQGDQMLPESKIALKSALFVDLTKNIVRLPLHKGNFNGAPVWYILTDASDFGIAHDLNVNYAPKLTNVAIGCPQCVQNVTLTVPKANTFDEAVVNFQGVPNFSPKRILNPGTMGFPPVSAQPGAVGDAHYSPFIRIKGSPVVYNASIVATGAGPFDVMRHSNTGERVIAIKTTHTATQPAYVDELLVHGSDAGQPILYLNPESSDPVAATYERTTYVPLLKDTAFLGGDDFLGSARERIFVFANGRTGLGNPQAQGENNAGLVGGSLDANVQTYKRIADPFNVQGDWPTLADPRHANAYSPLWDVQLGEWSKKAIKLRLNTRQTDENTILRLAVERPDLLTGPMGAPYGSVGFNVNCPVIGFTNKEPVKSIGADPQFQ